MYLGKIPKKAHETLTISVSQHAAKLIYFRQLILLTILDRDFSQIEKEKMNIKALPFILNAFTLVDGSLRRRTQVATGSEFGRVFGRVVASKEEAKQ
jgi:hypothetical protein